MPDIVNIPPRQVGTLQQGAHLVGENLLGSLDHQDRIGTGDAELARPDQVGDRLLHPQHVRFRRQACSLFQSLAFHLDRNPVPRGLRLENRPPYRAFIALPTGGDGEPARPEMSDGLPRDRRLDGSHQLLQRRPIQMRDEIEVLGKALSAVAPPDRASPLEDKMFAFGTGVEMLEEDQLEKFGAADMSFCIRLHTFSL